MTLKEVLIYSLMQYGIQTDYRKELDEKLPQECPQINKELKITPDTHIYNTYVRVMEDENIAGDKVLKLCAYISYSCYEHWKVKGRNTSGMRTKLKLIEYDLDLKKVHTKTWTR